MSYEGEYLKCFRIPLYFMKILAIFPFIFTRQGTTGELFISRLMAVLSVTAYAISFPIQAQFIIDNTSGVLVNFNFNEFISILPKISSRLFLFSLPLVIWMKGQQLHVYCDQWRNFQTELERIKGQPYSSPVKNKIRWATFSTAVWLALSFWYRLYFHKNLANPPSIISYVYITLPLFALMTYWYSNCVFIETVAKEVVCLTEKTIADNNEKKMIDVIELWMFLCNLNENFGSAHSNLFVIFLSYLAVNMVTSLYCSFYLFITEMNKWTSAGYLCYSLINLCAIVMFCETANAVFKQMVFQMRETILQSDVRQMNGTLSRSVLIFLETIGYQEPKISLNGFMVLNRSTVLSILGATIYYLVVLKQFGTEV